MKKRFISKQKRNKTTHKFIFFFLFFILGLIVSYKKIDNINENYNKDLTNILLNRTNHHNNIKKSVISIAKEKMNIKPVSLINNNYKKLVSKKTSKTKKLNNKIKDPIIYIYNTHQSEEYKANDYIEYSITPTVEIVNYILEEIFNKNDFKTVVEERRIKEVLNLNKWNYANSYKASRILIESAKKDNNTLKYFIDVHRDSLKKDKTTININNKSYAKILFIIGMENPNYEDNLIFTTKINNILDEKYNGLSKGILKKQGPGVNGVYNQDFSPNTILIEIGGVDNTVDEVLNTTIAFAECFMEVISKNEN